MVVVSVGTNDAAPLKHVPLTVFAQAVRRCMQSVPARRWVYVAPTGVDESRLAGSGDRTSAVLDESERAYEMVLPAIAAVVHATDPGVRRLG